MAMFQVKLRSYIKYLRSEHRGKLLDLGGIIE